MSGGYPYAPVMTETLFGYARCSADAQDLTAQRDRLRELGLAEERIYLDHGLTGTNHRRPAWTRPWPPSAAATRSWCRNSTGSPGPCPTPARSVTTWPPAASTCR